MPRQGENELKSALGASSGSFAMTGVFSFFINLLMLTAPLYMLQLYDRVLTSRSESTLVALTVLAAGLLIVMGALDFIRSRVLVRIGARIDQRLNARVFRAIFRQSFIAVNTNREQALRDLDAMRQFLTGPGPFALFDAPWVPIYLMVIFVFHPLLGYVALAGAALLFATALFNEVLTRTPLQNANAEVNTANTVAAIGMRNADAIAAMGMLPGILRRWRWQHEKGIALQGLASDRMGAIAAGTKALRMLLQIAILGVGAALVIDQQITPGTMIAASIIMSRALAPAEQAIGHWRGFVSARASYDRLKHLLSVHPEPQAPLQLPAPTGEIVVDRLFAGPPDADKPVLKGVSFGLHPGDALGVIGPSASGKSTLARLLVGVWEPMSGSVRLDGAETCKWPSEDLGPYIGYLPQNVELFDGSVAENICRFAPEPDDEAIVAAAQQADVHEMILHLPKGYETRIGEAGRTLSGGQRQRLGLARALYGDPVLVVLDEPNASLDAAGDEALTHAIQALKARNATVVVMAHRPSAIIAVDKLLILQEGKVVAFGPKDEVLAQHTVQGGAARPRIVEPVRRLRDQ